MITAREQLKLHSTAAAGSQAREYMLRLSLGGCDPFPVDVLSTNYVPEDVDVNVVEEVFSSTKVEEVYEAIAVEEVIEATLEEETLEVTVIEEVIETSVIEVTTTASDDAETYRC